METLLKKKLTVLTICFMMASINLYGQNQSLNSNEVFYETNDLANRGKEILKEMQQQPSSLVKDSRMEVAAEVLQKMDKSEYSQTNYSFVFDHYGLLRLNIEKTEENTDNYWLKEHGELANLAKNDLK